METYIFGKRSPFTMRHPIRLPALNNSCRLILPLLRDGETGQISHVHSKWQLLCLLPSGISKIMLRKRTFLLRKSLFSFDTIPSYPVIATSLRSSQWQLWVAILIPADELCFFLSRKRSLIIFWFFSFKEKNKILFGYHLYFVLKQSTQNSRSANRFTKNLSFILKIWRFPHPLIFS